MKLTIVLTVYNKEQYLHRAFEHLLNQEGVNHDDYEVIAVNDGSTDASAIIIDEYKNHDSRVRILTQDNQGLSMARNNGVDVAKGDYVWFVDADDTIAQDAVSLIFKAAKSYADVLPIYARTCGINYIRNEISAEAKTGKDVLFGRKWQHCGVFYVFKRSFLMDNDLRFLPGIYHEDSEFTPRMLYAAKTIQVIPHVLYTVYRDPDGITQVPRAKRAFDYLIVAERLSQFVIDNKETGTKIGKVINENIATDLNNAFAIICSNSKEAQKQLNTLFYDKRKQLLRPLRNAIQTKYKLEAVLFSLFPKQYVQIYKLLKMFS